VFAWEEVGSKDEGGGRQTKACNKKKKGLSVKETTVWIKKYTNSKKQINILSQKKRRDKVEKKINL